LALVSGALAPVYADALRLEIDRTRMRAGDDGDPVTLSPLGDDRFLVRAGSHAPLCDLLGRTTRPPGRGLRVEVDPATL
jgi:hypothetical protein